MHRSSGRTEQLYADDTCRGDEDTHGSSNMVACEIFHYSLDRAPAYKALSYNWGDPTDTVPIIVHGATVPVVRNLEAALRHLRLHAEHITLWIDALCIDQKNDLEKNEQIQQMRQIYTQASSVVAWLGSATDNSEVAMHWIREFGERAFRLDIGARSELRLQSLLDACEDQGRSLLVEQELKIFIEDLKGSLSLANTDRAILIAALMKFFGRPYWSRIWVVQELISACTVQFMCGSEVVTEDSLNHASRLLRNFGHYQLLKGSHDATATQPQVLSVRSISNNKTINLLKFRRIAQPLPLIHLLVSFRRSEASDPRDKVFGLLGIARDAESLGIYPDYRKSCKEVYADVARRLIQAGNIELLSRCRSQNQNQIVGLPSWAPDWSVMNSRFTLQERSLDRSARPIETLLDPKFSASGVGQRTIPKLGLAVGSETSLSLHAVFLGEVREVGTAWEGDVIGTWLGEIEKLSVMVNGTSEMSSYRDQAVWRTAVADQEIRQGIRKPRISEKKIATILGRLKNVNKSVIDSPYLIKAGLSDYCEQLKAVARGRRPLLVNNHLGIGPRETEKGDLIYIVVGADTPYILRRERHDQAFRVVGETYVHGVMDGEVMEGGPTIEMIALS